MRVVGGAAPAGGRTPRRRGRPGRAGRGLTAVAALAVVAAGLPATAAGGEESKADGGPAATGCTGPTATAAEQHNGGGDGGESLDEVTLRRLAGADRVGTAVAVSRAEFAAAEVVVLARAGDYADALAGAPLARARGGPLLLTPGGGLDERAAGELDRLGAERVVLLGGQAALSPQVAADARARGLAVERVAGANRFATAAAVAGELGRSETVYVAEGAHADPSRGWPDALAASPLAAEAGAPVLLATHDDLPEATERALGELAPSEVAVVGGAAAVGEAVARQAGEAAGAPVRRLAGGNRFATAAKAAEAAVAAGASPAGRWLATGYDFPDALAAGPAVAAAGETLLLAPGEDLAASEALAGRLQAYRGELRRITLLGGTAAISEEADEQLAAILGEHQPPPAGNAPSHASAISADGRHIAFASQAGNLAPGPAGAATQVLVRDRAAGTTTRVSTGPDGEPADADARQPAISAGGRYVAFTSAADNLTGGATAEGSDVYIHDRATGATELISRAAGGGPADGPSRTPAISAGGRYVVFASQADNLTGGESAEGSDVYVADRETGEVELVSQAAGGGAADGPSGEPAIAAGGQLIAFVSQASDLTAGAAAHPEVYLRDRAAGTTERVSALGEVDGPSRAPAISPDGRYLAFDTAAPGVVAAAGGATNPDTRHVIRLDRTSGEATVVTAAAERPSYTPAVADDGRVAFTSRANLTTTWPDHGHEQVYEWDDGVLVQLSADDDLAAPADADSRTPAISGNGAVVAFAAPATTLTETVTGGLTQVFAHTWVGAACIAVLASAADTAADSQPPPTATDDDDNRCEDRRTQPLLERAEEVHAALDDEIAEGRRTTAAVRARDHEGDCVVVFATGSQKDLEQSQIDELDPPGEIDAEPMRHQHAEITALTFIVDMQGWKPLALGIAPKKRVICDKLEEDASEERKAAGSCEAFIKARGGQILESRREAVWP